MKKRPDATRHFDLDRPKSKSPKVEEEERVHGEERARERRRRKHGRIGTGIIEEGEEGTYLREENLDVGRRGGGEKWQGEPGGR